jgi:hypothetical protein
MAPPLLPPQPGEGRILDGASPALAAVRQERRRNRDALQAEVEGWARSAAARGLSERAAVVVRRDRLCIPVRAGRQGELPRGSVCLATSATGNTLYMEPQVGAGGGGGGPADSGWGGSGRSVAACLVASATERCGQPAGCPAWHPAVLTLPPPTHTSARGGAEQRGDGAGRTGG